MPVTVVNEWYFKEDGDLHEGMSASAEYVAHLRQNPDVLLSLWLRDRDEPGHFFHITMFRDHDALLRERESAGTARFIERLFPQILQDDTFKAPQCDVWLTTDGSRVREMQWP